MRETIPEHEVITCDRCGAGIEETQRKLADIQLYKKCGQDYSQDYSIEIDLCDTCTMGFAKWWKGEQPS